MWSPPRFPILFLIVTAQAFSADDKSSGRLVTGCVDRTISAEHCGLTVRYQAKDLPVRVRTERTAEQRLVESSVRDYTVVQPAQIQGKRASILVQRRSGEFAVLSLVKQDGTWSILSVSEPTAQQR